MYSLQFNDLVIMLNANTMFIYSSLSLLFALNLRHLISSRAFFSIGKCVPDKRLSRLKINYSIYSLFLGFLGTCTLINYNFYFIAFTCKLFYLSDGIKIYSDYFTNQYIKISRSNTKLPFIRKNLNCVLRKNFIL